MKPKNLTGIGWIVFAVLSAAFLSAALLGVFSAFAQSPPGPPDSVVISFSEPLAPVPITDQFGNAAGEGVHAGQVRCTFDHCSGKTELSFTTSNTGPMILEYRFSSLQVSDSATRIVILSGWGTVSNNSTKERFSFSATIQTNPDGTLSAAYIASRPDASWLIPSTPGMIHFSSP